MSFQGLKKDSTRVRLILTDQQESRNYLCPLIRFTMPGSGDASLTVSMPSEVRYFKRITALATMANWAASQVTTTGGTPLSPASVSRAATVCNVFSRGFQRMSAQARSNNRSSGR
jgi:hypothetical protein